MKRMYPYLLTCNVSKTIQLYYVLKHKKVRHNVPVYGTAIKNRFIGKIRIVFLYIFSVTRYDYICRLQKKSFVGLTVKF